MPSSTPSNSTEARLRSLLSLTLTVGILGVAIELILLGHYEEWQQWLPFVALGVGLASVLLVVFTKSGAAVKLHMVVMLGFLMVGALGVFFHYSGNVEFELEMVPSIGGWELFKEAMTGATPALAPGAMVLIGLIGLVIAYRHPFLRGEDASAKPTTE